MTDDARLVAAAPDLLAALKQARATLVVAIEAACQLPDFNVLEHRVIKLIDAAIDKATSPQTRANPFCIDPAACAANNGRCPRDPVCGN